MIINHISYIIIFIMQRGIVINIKKTSAFLYVTNFTIFFLFVFIDSVYYVTYVYYAHFNSSFVTPLSLFFLSFLYIFFYKRSLFRLNSTYRPGVHRFISLVCFWLCEFTLSYFQFCYYRTFIVFYNQPMFKLLISWA